MRREQLKVRLFRLVDVLPALRDAREITRHARDYLADDSLPPIFRAGLEAGAMFPALFALAARQGVRQMANNFILAPDADAAAAKLRRMRGKRLAFTADILGETVLSEREADQYQQRYLRLIERLAEASEAWPRIELLDADDRGPIPRVNVSVKISALYSQIQAPAPEDAIRHLGERLRPILRLARDRGVFINFDMEHYALKDLTLELFKRLLGEEEFAGSARLGIVIQAYLRDSEQDLRELIAWAAEHQRRVTVRLVKGAYWDTETILARQRNWPVPVFDHKHETDAQYELLAAMMLSHPEEIDCAFGTHNVRSMAACIAQAEALGRDPRAFEIQMLYGMAEPIKQALVGMGHRVREYCPIGEILPGMSYLVRRLLENTSNEGFLRATFSDGAPVEELLRDPAEPRRTTSPIPWPEPPFRNEPHTDFTRAAARQQMGNALRAERARLGARYPLLIGDQEVRTGAELPSINPAKPSEVVGFVTQAGIPEADQAIAAAKAAFRAWSRTGADARAKILERAAALICEARFEIAALEVFEVGKTWAEADADVAEAVDFLPLLRGRDAPHRLHRVPGAGRAQRARIYRPGAGRDHRPMEFPARDPVRHDGRRARRGQLRDHEAVRTIRRARRPAGAHFSRSRRPLGRASTPLWPRLDRGRLPGGAPGCRPYRLYRLDGSWPPDLGNRRPHRSAAASAQKSRVRDGRQKRHHRRYRCRPRRSRAGHPRLGLRVPGAKMLRRFPAHRARAGL